MTQTTETNPQPNPETVIKVQKQEIDRLNDNRVWLLAVLEDTRNEALDEIGRLNGVLSSLRSLVPEKDQKKANAIVNGVEPDEATESK